MVVVVVVVVGRSRLYNPYPTAMPWPGGPALRCRLWVPLHRLINHQRSSLLHPSPAVGATILVLVLVLVLVPVLVLVLV